jgi:DNA invertase Pin-like site-specific DNA recombinase
MYPRVSTDGQSIASQIHALGRFIESSSWKLVRPAETYADDAISGAHGLVRLDGQRRLLQDAGDDVFDVVAVCGIDRLTRADDLIRRMEPIEYLRRAGILIADIQSGIHDVRSDQGELYAVFATYFAALERRKIRDRTQRGKRLALEQGRKFQAIDPYGLVSDEAGAFHVREDEAAAVRTIFELIRAGMSCREVAIELNTRGYPIRARRNRALSWTRDRVHKIARSSTYRGHYVVDRASTAALAVPAVVSSIAWYEVQDQLRQRRWRRSASPERARHQALVAGRGVCGLCGRRIRVAWGGSRRGPIRYYTCLARLRPEAAGASCSLPYRRVEQVDASVWSLVEELVTSGWRRVADEMAAAAARAPNDDQAHLDKLVARLGRLDRARALLVAQHVEGVIDAQTMDHETRALALERERVAGEVERLRADAGYRWTGEDVESTAGTIRDALASCLPEDREEILRALVPGSPPYLVTLGPDSLGIVVRLDPRAWVCPPSSSSGETRHRTYPAPIDVRLAA